MPKKMKIKIGGDYVCLKSGKHIYKYFGENKKDLALDHISRVINTKLPMKFNTYTNCKPNVSVYSCGHFKHGIKREGLEIPKKMKIKIYKDEIEVKHGRDIYCFVSENRNEYALELVAKLMDVELPIQKRYELRFNLANKEYVSRPNIAYIPCWECGRFYTSSSNPVISGGTFKWE